MAWCGDGGNTYVCTCVSGGVCMDRRVCIGMGMQLYMCAHPHVCGGESVPACARMYVTMCACVHTVAHACVCAQTCVPPQEHFCVCRVPRAPRLPHLLLQRSLQVGTDMCVRPLPWAWPDRRTDRRSLRCHPGERQEPQEAADAAGTLPAPACPAACGCCCPCSSSRIFLCCPASVRDRMCGPVPRPPRHPDTERPRSDSAGQHEAKPEP